MTAEQWFPVVSLTPGQQEWADALAASVAEVDPDPDRADAVLRDVFHVPLPRVSDEDEPDCWRCRGSREIPIGPGPLGQDLYDPCPACDEEA